MPLSWALIAILALGNFMVYGAMTVKERFAVRAAAEVAAAKGVAICNFRVGEIERAHNAKVNEGTAEARRAADLVPDPPATDAELAALCKKSASCRSRGAL